MNIGILNVRRQPQFCLLLAGMVIQFGLSPAFGSESKEAIISSQSSELHELAIDMRDEIKTHFRGTRYYGKLLAVNARIKARSAAVNRRYLRDQDYRGLKRDVERLNEWAYELSDVYRLAFAHANTDARRPVAGDTRHVVDKMANMIVMTESLNSSMLHLRSPDPLPTGVTIEFNSIPEFDPNQDVAPDVPPVDQPSRFDVEGSPAELELESPEQTARTLPTHSVLKK